MSRAVTIKRTFSRETSICITIHSDPAIIWKLLTTVDDFQRWNSTIVSIEGEISIGNKIKLKSTLDPKRTFKLTIKEAEPGKRLVWGDGQGNRAYEINKTGNGTVEFSMTEKIGGLMFPLYAKYIPPFDEAFEKFASDLKKESESIYKIKN